MRQNQFFSAAALGVVSRAVSILARLVSVPLTVTLLSQERYGLWLIISSLIGWLGFSDLGIPSALQNRLITVLRREGEVRAQSVVAFALRILGSLALLVFGIGVAAGLLVPWSRLFEIAPDFQREFVLTLVLCVSGFAISLPARVGGVIYNAHGRLQVQPLIDILVQIGSLSMLLVAVVLQWHSLLTLVACSLAGILLGPAALTFVGAQSYGYSFCGTAPTVEDRSALLSKGFFFFVTVIGELLILQSDAFVVGAMLGAAAVPLFMIPNTLWLNFLQAQNIFLRPLWPVLSHAYAAGERRRVRVLAVRTLLLSACGGLVFAAGLVLLGDWFVRFWSKGIASLPSVMAWGFGVYALAASVDNVLATCLNAFGCIEVRFGYTLLFGLTKVAVAIATLHFLSVSWLPWAFAAAMVATSIPFASMAFARALRRMPEPETA